MAVPFIVLVCLVCAPFFLLPTLIAYQNRKRSLGGIIAGNILLFVAMFALSPPGALNVAIALVAWLVMLHFSLRPDAPRDDVLDEDVTLLPSDPAWLAAFEAERRRICSPLDLPEDSVEHIGSTAVPGLLAKPVVDMMLGVTSLPPAEDLVSRLTILGYEHLGEAGVAGRVYLRLRGPRDFNLHVVARGGELWTNNLALRDLLRRDAAARERYAAGKQAAIAGGANRLLAYSSAKGPLVSELLEIARKA